MKITASIHEYTGETFKGEHLEDVEFGKLRFYDCRFIRCKFQAVRFKECRFHESVFRDCDLNFVDVTDSSFKEVQFENSRVIAANWTQAAWGGAGFLNSVEFTNSAINHSTFIGLELHDIRIEKCIARDADFAEADLTRANLRQTDLSNARFLHTNLTEADFTGAFNYSINASLNTLERTRFSLPEAMSLLHALDIILVGPHELIPDS